MNRYRAEILGRVPNGLTANDVYASAISLISEVTILESSSKRRLAGDMVSIVVTFYGLNVIEARKTLNKVGTGILGFSCDTVSFRDLGE
jgi:hypothetical protein